jgi:hypothetical protein
MFFTLLFALWAQGNEVKPALTCFTSPPSTSFVIWDEGENVFSRVIFHYGTQWAPSIAGIFTGNDLLTLERYASAAKRLQQVTDVRWPKKSCRQSSPLRFECFGTDDSPSGSQGEVVKPLALYTTTAKEDSVAGLWDTVSVNLSFEINGSRSQIEMKYYGDECFSNKGAAMGLKQIQRLIEVRPPVKTPRG